MRGQPQPSTPREPTEASVWGGRWTFSPRLSRSLLEEKRQLSRATFLIPGLTGSLSGRHPSPALPASYTALAVDGSHIDVDRHLPVQCFLINIGRVRIQYGASPGAWLDSEPRLYAGDDSLHVFEPEGSRYRPLEGPLLGAMRAVEELRALASPGHGSPIRRSPTIALIDGSLILWGLAGQAHPDFVRTALLEDMFLPAMEELRQLAMSRPLALASYISLPRSTEVVNVLRLDSSLCHYEAANCDMHCRALRPGQRPCDGVSGVLDRELFEALLEERERSDLFASTSLILEQYGDHRVRFFYLNAGSELARVEVPRWVAEDNAMLELTHAALVDQCRKGHGYPVAISEAHEQAVVTVGDREEFRLIMEDALQRQRLPVYTSEKNRSKRLKWL